MKLDPTTERQLAYDHVRMWNNKKQHERLECARAQALTRRLRRMAWLVHAGALVLFGMSYLEAASGGRLFIFGIQVVAHAAVAGLAALPMGLVINYIDPPTTRQHTLHDEHVAVLEMDRDLAKMEKEQRQ